MARITQAEGELENGELERFVLSSTTYPPTKSLDDKHYSLTDVGNAERFIALHGEKVHFSEQMKAWFIWNGEYWEKDANNQIRKFAHKIAKDLYLEASLAKDSVDSKNLGKWAKISLSSQKIESMIKEAKCYAAIGVNEFDNNQILLNVKNGVIDLETGELLSHNKDYLITKYIDIEYLPEKDCLKWKEFLNMIFNSNAELINYVQKLAGLSASGIADAQVVIFLYGDGANGKTTFINTLHKILGDYGLSTNIEAFLRKSHVGGVTPYLEKLFRKRFVTASEIPEGRRIDERLIKDLSGQDLITVNPKYEKTYSFSTTHKLWIFGNNKPVVRDNTHGFWRRLKVIPFEVKISEEEQRDMSVVINEFLEEAPGILNWLVEGFHKYQREGLKEPQPVKNATSEYRSEEDILQQFLDEECEFDSDYKIIKDVLLTEFNNWLFRSGENKFTMTKLSRQLKRREIKVGGSARKYYLGLRLRIIEAIDSESGNFFANNTDYSMAEFNMEDTKKQVESLFDGTLLEDEIAKMDITNK